jgi:hypothetical protein
MLKETIQLETVRQKIEDTYEASVMQSEMLDRGMVARAKEKETREFVNQHNNQAKALKEELKQLIAATRSQNPQAFEEWIDYHIAMLQKVLDEKSTEKNAAVRRNVAKGTIQEWEKVRAGEQEYVNINGYYLEDYRANVRKIKGGRTATVEKSGPGETEGKAWWQFWK